MESHFSALLVEEGANSDQTNGEIYGDSIYCPPPNEDEVWTVIARLKNNEVTVADGLTAELFKTGGDELISGMHLLINKKCI